MENANGELTIIDFHVHFPAGWASRTADPRPAIQAYQRERRERMAREWDLPDMERHDGTAEEMAGRWHDEVRKNHLARVVFMTGGGNDLLAQVVSMYPQSFSGFAHHDPAGPGAASELERAVEELGLKGYKLIAPRMTISFDDPRLRPLWTYAAQKKLPVLIHFGLLGHAGGIVSHPLINPLTLANVAREFSDVPFIIPHFGCGYFQELLHLCWSCPNILVDTSGSNQWVRWMPYRLDLEDLFRKTWELLGPERLVFGTDSSWFPRGFSRRYLLDQLRVCWQLGMKQDDVQLIFGGNAARLLGIALDP
ncbi:MAG: amidohydrolase family protein [Bacillota bacterium]